MPKLHIIFIYLQLVQEAKMPYILDEVEDFIMELAPHLQKNKQKTMESTVYDLGTKEVEDALYEAASWAEKLVHDGKLYEVSDKISHASSYM